MITTPHQLKKNKQTTIKDVAQRAEVSIATVSHVLNKTRHVEQQTEARVLKAIRDLKYKPNVLARSLKGKGTKTIGIIIADIRESFFANVVKAIESHLNKANFSLILCDSEDTVAEEKFYIEILLRKGIDGLIFAPVDAHESYTILQSSHIPIIQIDRKTYKSHADYIGIDNVKSAEMATQHLFDHGYKTVGFIGYNQTVYTMEKRLEGYKNVAATRGGFDDKLVKIVDYRDHAKNMKEDIKDWLHECRQIDAILCGVDNICYEALGAIAEAGLNVPDDIGIISFDDPKWFKYMRPPITAVRQPTEKIGHLAVESIMNRIHHKSKHDFTESLLDAELIIRESCGKH
jgi:LacI family transcriptional regulator